MKKIIHSGIEVLRDPCVLLEDGVYYVYGTGWVCYYSKSGLDGAWEGPVSVVSLPEGHECDGCRWAPEVHKYKDAYYMFTTYHSAKTGHRGCTVMKADNPLGPFVEITKNGPITPHHWDAIDGTLYIDEEGSPWMVFVHEWTCTDDNIGRMAAARLSEDLTEMISEPVELFRADDAPWSNNRITDGCWMYRCENGHLLMLWSNGSKGGYSVGIAHSESDTVEGPWRHEDNVLFSREITGDHDGGHGMIFWAKDGEMYLSIHSPNAPVNGQKEEPIFVPVVEKDGTLVLDL